MTPKLSAKFSRVRTGCLCCRKKKIKCDEARPSCANCEQSSIVCDWNTYGVSKNLLAEYKPQKKKYKRSRFILHLPERFSVTPTDLHVGKSNESEKSMPFVRKEVTFPKNTNYISFDPNTAFRKYLQQLGQTYLQGCKIQYINPVKLSRTEMHLMESFVHGFLVAVTPQFAHERLQPASIVLPRCLEDRNMRTAVYACGATYLSWIDLSYKELAERYYCTLMLQIKATLERESDIEQNHKWILISMVTLCWRERYQCKDTLRSSLVILACMKIILFYVQTFEDKLLGKQSKLSQNRCSLNAELLELINFLICTGNDHPISKEMLDHLTLSCKDIYHGIDDKFVFQEGVVFREFSESGYKVSAFWRTIIESVLYNFCVNILTMNASLMPYFDAPFIIFKRLRPYLTETIYSCPADWMNNPVMGAALPAFEIVAKSSWLRLLVPLDEKYLTYAANLKNAASFYTPPLLSKEAKFRLPVSMQTQLLDSCLVGVIVAKACYVLLARITDIDGKPDTPEISGAVDGYFDGLARLSEQSQAGGLCLWSFVIIGLTVTDESRRNYLTGRIKAVGSLKKSESSLRLINLLKQAWSSSSSIKPWDLLLKSDAFNDLFV